MYLQILLVGEYKGQKVQDVKKKIQSLLIEKNEALIYYEPEKEVVSRSGDQAVVALCDQWYLDYGNPSWKAQAKDALSRMDLTQEVRRNLAATIDWLHEHACSRTYGLGTYLPWDSKWIIESLSDSTIYMAYYTISHILQQGSLDGSKPGPFEIRPEHVTPEFFDYVFLGKGDPVKITSHRGTSVTLASIEACRHEFLYWYPMDLRATGKDLIPNHLTYSLFCHTAIWPNQPDTCWPRSFIANGHLMLNSAKMSKSTGNFLTLSEAIDKYSADGVRLALADAGDGLDDANIEESMAEAGLLRLHTLLEWMVQTKQQLVNEPATFRRGHKSLHADLIFENDINRTIALADQFFRSSQYKEVIRVVFYEFQSCRDRYREVTQGNLHGDLLEFYMETQVILLSPICSHLCEHLWRVILERKGSVCDATWPQQSKDVSDLLSIEGKHIDDSAHSFRLQFRQANSAKTVKAQKSGQSALSMKTNLSPSRATIWVATEYPSWQAIILDIMRNNLIYSTSNTTSVELASNAVISAALKPRLNQMSAKHAKRSMPFVQLMRERFQTIGSDVFSSKVMLDEIRLFEANKSYMVATLGLPSIDCLKIRPSSESADEFVRETACPLSPLITADLSPTHFIRLLNPDAHSGLFSLTESPLGDGKGSGCNAISVTDGDTAKTLITRILSNCRLSMPTAKDIHELTLWRYTDPIKGPRQLPPLPPSEYVQIHSEDIFMVVSSESSNDMLVMLKSPSQSTPIPLGDTLIYRKSVPK